MAESGYKIRGIGAPFETLYSSCSNLKPKKFNWVQENGAVDVHIDNGLLYHPDPQTPKHKRFGWICESKDIIPQVYNFLIHNYKVLFNNYYNKIFTCDKQLLGLNDNFKYVPNGSNYPWIKKNEWSDYKNEKTKICSMFASPKLATQGHIYRHEIALIAINNGFDVYGGAHGSKRTVVDPRNPWNTKLEGMKNYMFNIVIENALYDDYYTEKLTDCFATGTIPIYYGTMNIPSIFDKNGIIRLEKGNEKEILNSINRELWLSKEKAIQNNLQALQELQTADDVLFEEIFKYEKY
jgi:hypothetical protein